MSCYGRQKFPPWLKFRECRQFCVTFIVLVMQITLQNGAVQSLWSWCSLNMLLHCKWCTGAVLWSAMTVVLVKMSQYFIYFIVLCPERHRIHHGMSIRRKMVTLRMDVWCFTLSQPHAKQHKSTLLLTIFLPIGSPWWILRISSI